MRDFLYCLIFPHPSNNHRAHVLHPKALLLIISFLIFGSLFFSSNLNPLGSRIKAFAEVSALELINFTNQKRVENGLSVLSLNSQLSDAAENKAEDMIEKDYWAHNSPDGITPWVFIKASGYEYVYAGENLARGFRNSDDIVNAWMASPTHRANLLSPKFKEVGFSVKSGNLNGEETILVVQEFGSKSVLAATENVPQTPISNTSENKIQKLNLAGVVSNRTSLSISSEIVIFAITLFILIFAIDYIYIKRKKIIRFTGHNFDHMLFLGVIIFIIVILNTGAIL